MVDTDPFCGLLYDISQCKDLVSASSSLPESRLFLVFVNSCLDSSKQDSTETFAGDGQECDSSAVVRLKVALLGSFIMSPLTQSPGIVSLSQKDLNN